MKQQEANKQEEVYALIEQHYRANYDKLLKGLSRYQQSQHNAEDIIQEAYTRACQYWESFAPNQGIDGWMHGIVNNATRDFYRKEIVRGMTDSVMPAEVIDQRAFNKLQLEELVAKIKEKPENIARALYLCLIDGFTAREVSEILPFSITNVTTMVNRFRDEIKEAA